MMRSMYSGVSGLKTHQTKMDVIGNNIANVNTVAYKSSSITFSELMYQTTQRASGPNALTGTGGTNARQIGLGVQSAAINTAIASQGATQTTGNPFDICITGSSFFVVNNGSENFFTRAGAFTVDSVGNLVMTSNGYNVMGWQYDETIGDVKKDIVTPLRIMSAENMTFEPEATTKGYVSGIMDKNEEDAATEAGKSLSLSFYDKLGYSYTAKYSIHNTTEDGEYYVTLDDIQTKGDDGKMHSILESYPDGTNKDGTTLLSDIVTIGDTTGFAANVNYSKKLLSTATVNKGMTGIDYSVTDEKGVVTKGTYTYPSDNGKSIIVTNDADDNPKSITYKFSEMTDADKAKIGDEFRKIYDLDEQGFNDLNEVTLDLATGTLTVNNKTVRGSKLKYDKTNGYFDSIDGNKSITMKFATSITDKNGTAIPLEKFKDIDFDWSATNMFNNSGTSTLAAKSGDTDGRGAGRKLGNMSGITVQTNGKIYASYDNGMTQLLGQIAVAEFTNAAGLEKAGENLYSATLNSGEFDGIGVDISASGGYMTTGVLEMSNVDLSAEFTEMITTQRGFQANSRIITVSDTMLEELVNLKR
ncbi:MAG: flagellar hook-basal body complex protein [Lachnospiraceae bacterium]|nr:flagellar hook-basal body complex protein [Lachnospiraceae bacterium]